MREAAQRLVDLGAKSVLVKGGHLEGGPTDILLHRGEWHEYPGSVFVTQHTHGTGCTYSAAITACVAKGVSCRKRSGSRKRTFRKRSGPTQL